MSGLAHSSSAGYQTIRTRSSPVRSATPPPPTVSPIGYSVESTVAAAAAASTSGWEGDVHVLARLMDAPRNLNRNLAVDAAAAAVEWRSGCRTN